MTLEHAKFVGKIYINSFLIDFVAGVVVVVVTFKTPYYHRRSWQNKKRRWTDILPGRFFLPAWFIRDLLHDWKVKKECYDHAEERNITNFKRKILIRSRPGISSRLLLNKTEEKEIGQKKQK